MTPRKDTILLVDGHALIHRGYHALPNLTNHQGEPTGAIFGFTRLLLSALKILNPEYVVVAFDSRGLTFRHHLYKEYKAARVRAPEDLYIQIPVVEKLVKTLNIPVFKVPGFEADDIIATLAKQAEKQKLTTTILTGDMDLVQLINDHVSLFAPTKGVSAPTVYTPATVREKYTFGPDKIVFFKALRGDASDNIPGVPGVGEVTAKKIIAQVDSLDELYQLLPKNHLKGLSEKIEAKIITHKDQAYLSQQLATVDTKVPVTLVKKDCSVHDYNRERVVTMLAELGFRSLLRELPDNIKDDSDVSEATINTLFDTAKRTEPTDYHLNKDLQPVLRAMETKGVLVDGDYLSKINTKFIKDLERPTKAIYRLAKHEFNINSTQQLATVLYEELKLPTHNIKQNLTALSTDANQLDLLQETHPIIKYIIEYRELSKLINTYTEPLGHLIAADGRLHTTYGTDTATGRISSKNPNLQQIPIRSDRGKEIRHAFIAAPHHTLIAADYSQIELRVVAHLSKDPVMITAFRSGKDIHDATSKEMGVDRRVAKVINFSILYGKGPHGFARDLKIDIKEAKEYIDRYFKTYSGIQRWIDETLRFVSDHGYVETLFGLRRPFPSLKGRRVHRFAALGREAINMPVQGTAAEILKRAMIAVNKDAAMKDLMVLTVHDELVLEVPTSKVKQLLPRLRHIMETTTTLDVPLEVSLGSGHNWGEIKD